MLCLPQARDLTITVRALRMYWPFTDCIFSSLQGARDFVFSSTPLHINLIVPCLPENKTWLLLGSVKVGQPPGNTCAARGSLVLRK